MPNFGKKADKKPRTKTRRDFDDDDNRRGRKNYDKGGKKYDRGDRRGGKNFDRGYDRKTKKF